MKNISRMDNSIWFLLYYLIYCINKAGIYPLFYNISPFFIHLIEILETKMRIRHVNNFRNNPS